MENNLKVGRWGRFESSLANLNEYKDPYNEVTLNVEYTRPDGSKIKFWGFYDGVNTWKFRCMPDQLGTWCFKAAFSDGTGQAAGAFECVESDIRGMLHKDEVNPMWFGFKGGKHLLVRSFHVGDRFFAENWEEGKRQAFLDWAGTQGYNMLSAACHYLNRQQPGRGQGWETPRLWPLNYVEFGKMERILDELAKRHIMVYPFAGFFGRSSNYPDNNVDQVSYIRYIIARLGAYWNLAFNVAGPEPLLNVNPFMKKDEVNRLGRLIKEYNVFDHLITVHNATGNDPFMNEDYLSFGTLQGPKTRDRLELNVGLLRNHSCEKPLLAQETLWPGNICGHPVYSNVDIRKNAIVILMSAAALNFADNQGDSSSGFTGSLDLNDAVEERHSIVKKVWDFFETLEFYRMIPSQQLVDNGFCLAEEGREYLVYLEAGGKVNISVKEGQYSVEWINASETSIVIHGEATASGKSLNAPDENDWFVHLKIKK